MNFLQIAQSVKDALDDTRPNTIYNSDLGILSADIRRLRENINLAYTLVKQGLGWRNESAETTGVITTISGTENYSFPAGILTISQLKVGQDPPIPILPWPEYERYKSDTYLITGTGSPDVAAIFNRQVWLYPVPDAAYTVDVRGYGTLTELDADNDEPSLPQEFHRSIRDLALYLEMVYENNPQAGILLIGGQGDFQGQGGQAAIAAATFNMVKKNFRSHFQQQPRIIGLEEIGRMNAMRRIIRG